MLYAYHFRLLMHFTSQKPLNMCNYLFKSISKMSEKIKMKNKEHYPSLFHHNLIKTIFIHQLAEKGMTWEPFLETTLKWHEANVAAKTSSIPQQQMEVGSSRKPVDKTQVPRPEVTKIYKRGNSHGEKEAKPSTSTKQGSTTQDKDTVEHDFELVNSEVEDQTSSMQQTIIDK